MTSFKFPIAPAMHPCTEQFITNTIPSALKFSNVYLYKFVYLCNLILFQNMLFLKIVSIIKIIMFGDQWCSGKSSLVGTLAWHYDHMPYGYL